LPAPEKNRRKQSERKFRLPAVNGARSGSAPAHSPWRGIGAALVMWAFNQPIETVAVEGASSG